MAFSCLSPARLSTMLLAVSLAVIGTDTSAQDLEPRTYANTPVGLNFLIASYAHTTGGVATDPAIPLQNASIDAHGPFLAYACALNVWGVWEGRCRAALRLALGVGRVCRATPEA